MNSSFRPVLIALACVAAAALWSAAPFANQAHAADDKTATPPKPAAASKPALTVTLTQPQAMSLPQRISANGNVTAWQEASVGTEAHGLRLAEVRVNVGDVVKRGQVLATFAAETVQADVAQARASVAEAEAHLSEAAANAQRARDLQPSGMMSAQQINQLLTAERTAAARVEAARAGARVQQLRLTQTQVRAPDDGIISARSATVGAVLPSGQELFRLIRQSRLEWRAEVNADQLVRIQPGMAASVSVAGAAPVAGKVRKLAPTVDAATRNGVVYVDLPAPGAARAGMFARGDIQLGEGQGLTLPQSAVLLRDGFHYVLRVGADNKVSAVKVQVGRRVGERVEVVSGLAPGAQVVAAGGAFLGDGDTVRVVAAAAAAAPAVTKKSNAPL